MRSKYVLRYHNNGFVSLRKSLRCGGRNTWAQNKTQRRKADRDLLYEHSGGGGLSVLLKWRPENRKARLASRGKPALERKLCRQILGPGLAKNNYGERRLVSKKDLGRGFWRRLSWYNRCVWVFWKRECTQISQICLFACELAANLT